MRRDYTLKILQLGLRDLVDKRKADLLLSNAGKYYAPKLEKNLAIIDGLPPAYVGGEPLAADLERMDGAHDGWGSLIFFTTEAAMRRPNAPADVVGRAQRIRDVFIPALSVLQQSYTLEAHRAKELEAELPKLKGDLEQFPVAGGGTLYEVAAQFVATGISIGELLSNRGDVAKVDRKRLSYLRSECVGMLNRLRDDIVRELRDDPSLPRDLETRVFSYFDTMVDMAPRPKPEDLPIINSPLNPTPNR